MRQYTTSIFSPPPIRPILHPNKIRHYKIEDRGNLRNIHSSEWPKQYEKYLKDVSCPFKLQERQEAIDWLLGLAVRLEYGDNAAKYQVAKPLNTEATKSVEPLINLDGTPNFSFKQAIRILVQERLSPEAVAKSNSSKEVRLCSVYFFLELLPGCQF
ncbi:RNA transcription, translation and transport factor protein [Pyxicephalus adspersus]|uniref:RNA transcription, translation and transport factor protein n=1 Tax=Pyxicephalus adspersus TaxID=30357 RepID=UPI003B5C7BBE